MIGKSLFATLSVVFLVNASFVAAADLFAARVHQAAGISLPYRLFVPANYSPTKKYPIILTLHGAGERGTDNASQLVNNIVTPWIRDSVQQKHPCFIVSPQCPPSLTWGNFDWSTGYYRIGATQ